MGGKTKDDRGTLEQQFLALIHENAALRAANSELVSEKEGFATDYDAATHIIHTLTCITEIETLDDGVKLFLMSSLLWGITDHDEEDDDL